uniref:Uncharacterized protein n=1 Tax=Gouania willdenowi TaxID=441366 RepID=A0A8C5EDS5_GOUWI
MLLQGGHHHGSRCHCTWLYLEVTRVHLQFLRVQHAQLCICSLDVVHVLHSLLQGLHDHFSMSCYFGIGGDSSSIVEVSKAAKVPLSPGSDNGGSSTGRVTFVLYLTFTVHTCCC